MPDVVICEPLRTPVGRFGGVFRDVAPEDLASTLITELVTRTGISGAEIDDVILGQASPNGEAPAIGRIAALNAGLGVDVPGMQVDRRCGSGLQAIIQAVMQVQSGGSDLVLAGGAESRAKPSSTQPECVGASRVKVLRSAIVSLVPASQPVDATSRFPAE